MKICVGREKFSSKNISQDLTKEADDRIYFGISFWLNSDLFSTHL